MSMSDVERVELVKLWREIPKCIPFGVELRYVESAGWLATPHDGRAAMWPDYLVSALARDAIVEWLHSIQCQDEHRCVSFAVEDDSDPSRKYAVEVGRANWWHGPTRLLALIAAARAVGGKG